MPFTIIGGISSLVIAKPFFMSAVRRVRQLPWLSDGKIRSADENENPDCT
jgi:hypothetical protein